jgi:hypothetical protein
LLNTRHSRNISSTFVIENNFWSMIERRGDGGFNAI